MIERIHLDQACNGDIYEWPIQASLPCSMVSDAGQSPWIAERGAYSHGGRRDIGIWVAQTLEHNVQKVLSAMSANGEQSIHAGIAAL